MVASIFLTKKVALCHSNIWVAGIARFRLYGRNFSNLKTNCAILCAFS
ncbi:hypothetical protein D1AOALGA4SA_5324 [Olavius algarvensis Delta 1 endosymbiont]|nr:hypothetical protein D1AOALGA4SA_5324 [Olavius algarvensis Delta 1 endosymbiont]